MHVVMIDAGSGSTLGPTLGRLLGNLAAAGYAPGDVDEIYLTHLHLDHLGGLVTGGARAFSNAIVRADRRDVDYWLADENLRTAPDAMKSFFQGAQSSLRPYVAAGKLRPFDGDTELVPGLRAVAAHGHTPGHTVYRAESRGQTITFWGDVVHVAAVQMPAPAVTITFDADPKAAAAQRRKVFADTAKQGSLVGAAHLAFPGIGRLRADGKGYAWAPVNYSSQP